MYLLDTNVWLQRLLTQERADEVGRFINSVPSEQIHITDFAFHSVCVILSRLKHPDVVNDFIDDAFGYSAVGLVRLTAEETRRVLTAMATFNLDFDDAYQYIAAEKYNLTLVSFDADFDQTERGRKTPGDVLKEFQETAKQSRDE